MSFSFNFWWIGFIFLRFFFCNTRLKFSLEFPPLHETNHVIGKIIRDSFWGHVRKFFGLAKRIFEIFYRSKNCFDRVSPQLWSMWPVGETYLLLFWGVQCASRESPCKMVISYMSSNYFSEGKLEQIKSFHFSYIAHRGTFTMTNNSKNSLV